MSSTIEAATSNGAVTEWTDAGVEQSGRIIHFDATLRRKERMRQAATKPRDPIAGSDAQAAAAPGHGNGIPNGRQNGSAAIGSPDRAGREAATEHAGGTHANGAAAPAAKAPEAPSANSPATVQPASNGTAAAKPNSQARLSGRQLEEFLIDFVVEQTGYPPEMVELDADLEADLGIDSIKKAQLFGELAEHFDVPVENAQELSLDQFPTLRHVVEFLESASQPASGRIADAAANDSLNGLSGRALEEFLINFVVEQTGYPPEMVELDADLEADLGIDSIKKAQLFGELAEHFDVPVENARELSLDEFPTLRYVMGFLESLPQESGSNAKATDASDAEAGRAADAAIRQSVSEPRSEVAASPPQPVAASEAPEPAAQPHADAGMSGRELADFLINFVVEQTGYPPEMVELDADLEADLGIDSIKKAQLFGELAEHFDVQVENARELSLDEFPTLRHVMNFLEGVPRKALV